MIKFFNKIYNQNKFIKMQPIYKQIEKQTLMH